MEPVEADKMSSGTSYPSPTAQHASLPFYSQHAPTDRDSQPHAPTASMQSGDVDARHFTQTYGQAQLSTPQQLAQQGLNINQDGPSTDGESAKKKQKVSRACDECRRKKIKCDAIEGDTSKPTCSACVRSETTCQFTRAPQKRGPSKGYIKDLAERVQNLEHQNKQPFQSIGRFAPDITTYSPAPDFLGSGARQGSAFVNEDTQQFASSPEHLHHFGKSYTPNMSSTGIVMPDPAFTFPGGFDPLNNVNNDIEGLNLYSIDEYYREIHTLFPILPDSKIELQSVLDSVRKQYKDALLANVDAAMLMSKSANNQTHLESAKRALSQLQDEELTERTNLENLVLLQAYIFLIIAREAGGPGKNQSQLAYSMAMTHATHLNLQFSDEIDPNDAADLASFKSNGRRAYLMLWTLDRWHMASTIAPSSISEDFLELLSSDRRLLGESAYNLVRLTVALGHVTATFLPRRVNEDELLEVLLVRSIKGELERFHEGVELSFPTQRHIQLAYLHAKLLADRTLQTYGSKTSAIISGAFKIIKLLPNDQNHASPLTHHFAALAAITLGEILERDPSPIGNALRDLQNGLNNGSVQYPLGISGNRPAWSNAIAKFINSRLDPQNLQTGSNGVQRGGLQHLADAAVGGDDGNQDGEETGKKLEGQLIDWREMTKAGYLKLFE